MAIEEILDEIENLVVEAKRVPFTNKCMIEDDDLVRLIDDLRNELPQEIQRANAVIEGQQRTINEANIEANKIIEQAKSHAATLLNETEILRQAQEQANELMEKTIKNANELKQDSINYADEVFSHLASNIGNALSVVQQAKDDLNSKR